MDILGFIITLLPIIISPGASFAIALNSTLNNGMKGLIVPIVGTGLGIITHGLLVGVGLTKILASSEWMMNLIGILGTIYLLYLSFLLIISGIRASENRHQNKIKKVTIKDAYLSNLLNPKAIILYLVVVSSFAGDNPTLLDFLFLSIIHTAIMALWLILCCGILVSFSSSVQVTTLRKYINIGGGILLLLIILKPFILG